MKQNKTLLIAAVVVLILAAVAAYVNYTGSTKQIMVADNTNQPLIGGQKDAGGCLIAAGYSWCEPKKKCLRIWEEKCYEAEEAALTKFFAAEHKQPVTETQVTVVKLQNNFAGGSISFGPTPGEGGGFLGRLINGDWTIDYEGNGSIDCAKIRALGYPQDVLEGYCDVACTQEAKLCSDGSAVGRTGPNCEFAPCPGEDSQPTAALLESEARAIAEKSCIKGGEALAGGVYNEITKTWWFDANLNATREGCNPACVVSEATKTAEINWRCTGLIVPKE
jgi:hypothetical protein